jgi:hypothetical protein
MKREPGKVHRPERIGAMRLSHGFQLINSAQREVARSLR